jgi:hypothetical protein
VDVISLERREPRLARETARSLAARPPDFEALAMSRRPATGLVAGLVALGVLWFVRPVFQGIVLFFFVNPLIWFPPLAVLMIGFLAITPGAPRDLLARPGGPQ